MSTSPRSDGPGDVARRPSGALDRIRARLADAGLVRPSRGKLVAGVLVGISRRYDVSPWVVRVAFLASMLLPGPQILLYLALWIVMPRQP